MIDRNELLFVVDENNTPVDPKPRFEVHAEGYWHRNSHIWVKSQKNQILCHKRSKLKDTNPGRWEMFFGGHLAPKEEYVDVAVRELKEEVGLILQKTDLLLFAICKSERAREFIAAYLALWNGMPEELRLETEEVDEIRWVAIETLKEITLRKDPDWNNLGYEESMLQWISERRSTDTP